MPLLPEEASTGSKLSATVFAVK